MPLGSHKAPASTETRCSVNTLIRFRALPCIRMSNPPPLLTEVLLGQKPTLATSRRSAPEGNWVFNKVCRLGAPELRLSIQAKARLGGEVTLALTAQKRHRAICIMSGFLVWLRWLVIPFIRRGSMHPSLLHSALRSLRAEVETAGLIKSNDVFTLGKRNKDCKLNKMKWIITPVLCSIIFYDKIFIAKFAG